MESCGRISYSPLCIPLSPDQIAGTCLLLPTTINFSNKTSPGGNFSQAHQNKFFSQCKSAFLMCKSQLKNSNIYLDSKLTFQIKLPREGIFLKSNDLTWEKGKKCFFDVQVSTPQLQSFRRSSIRNREMDYLIIMQIMSIRICIVIFLGLVS